MKYIESRKLIKFGNSSFVISLPNKWLKKHKLKKGDRIYIGEDIKDHLIIRPGFINREDTVKEIKINIENKSIDRVKREVVSAYINGYNIINIFGKGMNEKNMEIRKVIDNLMALEVMEQTENSMMVVDFLNIKNLSIENVIKRMDIITRSMSFDLKNIFMKKEKNYNIIFKKDEDINRLFFLIRRTKRSIFLNPEIHKSLKCGYLDMCYYFDVANHIEQIADWIKRITECLKKHNIEDSKVFLEVYLEVEDIYNKTLNAFYTKDIDAAYELSVKNKKVIEKCNEFYEKYLDKKGAVIITNFLCSMIFAIHSLGRIIYT